ncbi:MAG: FUSC family protein [Nevskia sp.]|nr:FUSC family protein [Nevskia sp.]
MKHDYDAALFSLKCFAAAMLAYYCALAIGLPRPYWALGTVYIVSQPLAGASISRGVFRFAGTFIGATATVILVPAFANEPLVLSMALSLWIALCLFLAILDRTPRSYLFVLAGYTTSLIGFPSVSAPASIFQIASLRVQEISIGILAAGLVHALVVPKSATALLAMRISNIIDDAERWSRDALDGARDAVLARDRRRLALDLNDLHQLAVHLTFDSGRGALDGSAARALHDRLAVILPLASAIEDRIADLRNGAGVPAGLEELCRRVKSWLGDGSDAANVQDLIATATTLDAKNSQGAVTWHGLLLSSVLGSLQELVTAHRDCRQIQQHILARGMLPAAWETRQLLAQSKGHSLHRDYGHALRSAAGAAVGITLGSIAWIFSAWPDGGTALLIFGVCCALFGTAEAPAPNVKKYLLGSCFGVVVGFIYCIAILPRVTDFAMLVAVLAPALLVAGSVQARPPLYLVALGATLTLSLVAGLGATNIVDLRAFLNSGLALLVGTGAAVASVRLFQTVAAEDVARRVQQAGWRDVVRQATGRVHDHDQWTSRMLDRLAVLGPRLGSHTAQQQLLADALIDLRVGYAAGQLAALQQRLPAAARRQLRPLLTGLAAAFSSRTPLSPHSPAPMLLPPLDDAIYVSLQQPAALGRPLLIPLVGMRRDLFPTAPDIEIATDDP